MIGYFTDNSVSHGVMGAFQSSGIPVKHISRWTRGPSIFYGILRGTGPLMRHCDLEGIDYWYIDNGYFDAVYMDELKRKDLIGKYRIVRNGLIEQIHLQPKSKPVAPLRLLLLPPTPYSAFMHDTTPEDWNKEWLGKARALGHHVVMRTKDTTIPFSDSLTHVDAVLAFNSMGIMQAIEHGKAVYTTHGCIRNSELFNTEVPYYNIEDLKRFYEPKQYTLEEIKDKGVECLI